VSKRYGNLEIEEQRGDAWASVASVDGGKDEADKWISQHGQDGKRYRVVRSYPPVDVAVQVVETRTVTVAP